MGARPWAYGLLVGWIAWLVCAFVLGERASTWGELQTQVAAGDVRTVSVTEGMSEGGRGFAVVEVHWREGIRAYTTTVVEAQPLKAGRKAADGEGITAVIDQPVGDRLQELSDVRMDRVEHATGPSTEVFGWHLTGWPVPALVVLYLLTLVLLVAGPEPRRATRWAWFWLITSVAAPVTAIAFVARGGPISRSGEPPKQTRRLTGGWAFLLCLAINTLAAIG